MKRRIVHVLSVATVALTLAAGVVTTSASDEQARKVNEYEGQHLTKKGSFDITEAEGIARKANEYEGQHRIAEQGDPSQWGATLAGGSTGEVVVTTNPT
jgi:hypothetical protein